MSRDCDLLVVGAGPAGLSATINAASEGLDVVLVDSGQTPGGQAVQSSEIANYPGFPNGITGQDLMSACLAQAAKFNADIRCPEKVVALRLNGSSQIAITEDGDEICAKAIVLSPGLSYKRLNAKNIGAFMGRGVQYGAPTSDPKALGECCISIVGGANSAGQAAVHMAKNDKAMVRILIRKKIEAGMSDYLIKKIRAMDNIKVLEGVEVLEVQGNNTLEKVIIKDVDGKTEEITTHHLFVFIGASPKTLWLRDSLVTFDNRGFIITGHTLVNASMWQPDKVGRVPFPFEAAPGVFAVGDVRANSIKRIASAVGEGSAVIPNVHQYLALNGK